MKTTIKFISLFISMMFATSMTYAQVQVEIDIKSAEQIIYNTGVAALHENAIKDTVTVSRKRNDSIAAMASTITALNVLYHNARQNITGFGKESAIYKQIKTKALALVPKIGTAISVISHDPISIVEKMENISKIERILNSLVKQYTDIVTNGRVPNPLTGNTTYKYSKCPKCGGPIDIIKTDNPRKPYVYACKNRSCGWDTGSDPEAPDDGSDGDGYNFLSSRDRYMMASAILTDLNRLDWQLTIIIYSSKQKAAKMSWLAYVDFKTYATLWETKAVAQRTYERIRKLGNMGH